MKSTVEPLEGNKVKLSIEVDEAEFEKQIDAAFRRIAREVRLPGFRPGKAPRKVLEARIGMDAARGDALEHAIPEYYVEAVQTHDVDVIWAMAHHVLVMKDGQVVESGSVEEVLQSPRDPYTQALVAAAA